MITYFEKKSFSFKLKSKVVNSKSTIYYKKGWIIKLKNKNNLIGYGEIAPLALIDLETCEKQINQIPKVTSEINILENINKFHPCIQSGIKSALAEMKGKIKFNRNYPFLEIDQTAILLNSERIIEELTLIKKTPAYKYKNLTIKWKVAIEDNIKEEKLLEQILNQIPINFKLRIDANGSWNRKLANRWAEILKDNKNLDWLEQPLDVEDIEGLKILNDIIPIALDESLIRFPELIEKWQGWQIRRPSQDKNPIKLLKDLISKKGFISLSTSFETGIGSRFLYHCAFLQLKGPTPKVPGLAIRQTPKSFLFSSNPHFIWDNL